MPLPNSTAVSDGNCARAYNIQFTVLHVGTRGNCIPVYSGKLFAESNKKKNWNVADILGRSKDGFQPVNTEEREGMLGDDSDSEASTYQIQGATLPREIL